MADKKPPQEEEYKTISLKMRPTLIGRVDSIRKSKGDMSRSSWIRQAILEKLDRDEKPES